MSAADSEESRWPDFATASIRTQSRRRTVAHRSSSAIECSASVRSASLRGGLGSGTGVRCLTSARLAADPISFAGYGRAWTETVVRNPCLVRSFARRPLVWLAVAALATGVAVLLLSGDEDGGPPEPAWRQEVPTEASRALPREQHEPGHEPAHEQGRRSAPRRRPGWTPTSASWRGSSVTTWRHSTRTTVGAPADCSCRAPWRRSTSPATVEPARHRCRPPWD